MAAAPGADERRIRNLLLRRGVGPDAPPAPPAPPVTEPAREPDWFDRLYADEQPAAVEPDAGEQHRWYSVTKEDEPPDAPSWTALPGVHVTITPTPGAAISPRRARIRWWTLRRGTAATVGWWIGLGPATSSALTESGSGAIGLGVALYVVAWYGGTLLLRCIPAEAVDEVRTAVDWAARLPSATVLLALALHTPGALS
jgi:hypothetical protein